MGDNGDMSRRPVEVVVAGSCRSRGGRWAAGSAGDDECAAAGG